MSKKDSIRFKDRLIKGVSPEGYFRISVVKTTDVVRSAKKRHNLSLLNTLLLGRTLTASMLLASELKGEERIQLKLEGSGPVGMLTAEANRAGEIRGYSKHPGAELDYSDPDISIEDALGAGLLHVSKTLYNEAEPHNSSIQLFKGDVTTDVAHYLIQSEQIPSAILLDLRLDKDGRVEQSGGLLLQRLPDAPDDVVEQLQKKIEDFGNVSDYLSEKIYIDEIMKRAVDPFGVKELDRQPVHFFCRCNRDRFISALALLNYQDLKELEGESQEIVCRYCSNKIDLSKEEIDELVLNAHARLN